MTIKINLNNIIKIVDKRGNIVPILLFNKLFRPKSTIYVYVKQSDKILTFKRHQKLKIINDKIAVISCFKNESHILTEWIEHYLREGVDYFYLVNNGSTDDFMTPLQPYIDRGIVFLTTDDTKHAQASLLYKYGIMPIKEAPLCQQCEWIINVDLDEFMYGHGEGKNIKSYLSKLSRKIKQVSVPWKMFGSSGFIEQPVSVVDNFINREQYLVKKDIYVKSIARTQYIQDIIPIHVFNLIKSGKKKKKTITCDGKKHSIYPFTCITEHSLINCQLHLNHYAIQSKNWFKSVKMTRGDVCSDANSSVRNEEYFRNYDHNDIVDNELRLKYPKRI